MLSTKKISYTCALLLLLAQSGLVKTIVASEPQSEMADVADVPSQDLRAGDDAKKRYLLIGDVKKESAPADGYALLVVLPGGDGSADFEPFVRRIYKNVLNERWLIAEPVAPQWNEKQFDKIVWPTAALPYKPAKFTTEQFVAAVVADVQAKTKIDARRVFLLGWSSGGPPCYAATLRKGSPVRGALVAMSVFDQKSNLKSAKDKIFYLLQSPDDRVTPFRFAEMAEKNLTAAGAKVRLQQYAGGHGWQGDVWTMIGGGVEWLDKQADAKP